LILLRVHDAKQAERQSAADSDIRPVPLLSTFTC
jgi:hypothetical protein